MSHCDKCCKEVCGEEEYEIRGDVFSSGFYKKSRRTTYSFFPRTYCRECFYVLYRLVKDELDEWNEYVEEKTTKGTGLNHE